jgi:hypothetical protein
MVFQCLETRSKDHALTSGHSQQSYILYLLIGSTVGGSTLIRGNFPAKHNVRR